MSATVQPDIEPGPEPLTEHPATEPAVSRQRLAAMWPSEVPIDDPGARVDVHEFEAKYRAEDDPWNFATSWYEQRRYDLIMAMLPRTRYVRCFEPGASIGELTKRLAVRCDEVVGVEASATAATRASSALAEAPHATVVAGTVPEFWPSGRFDLVVLSEFGYYFDRAVLTVLVERLADVLEAGGTFVAAHWRGVSNDHLLGGDEVHDVVRGVLSPRLGPPTCVYTEADVRIDMWGTA